MKAQIHNFNCWIVETDPYRLKKEFDRMLKKSGFGIVGVSEKTFEPQGYTCVYLLSESHLAIHTFPEENATYIELSSCVKNPFMKFILLPELTRLILDNK